MDYFRCHDIHYVQRKRQAICEANRSRERFGKVLFVRGTGSGLSSAYECCTGHAFAGHVGGYWRSIDHGAGFWRMRTEVIVVMFVARSEFSGREGKGN